MKKAAIFLLVLVVLFVSGIPAFARNIDEQQYSKINDINYDLRQIKVLYCIPVLHCSDMWFDVAEDARISIPAQTSLHDFEDLEVGQYIYY